MPRLWFFTDPQRTPDPAAIAQRLPFGAAIVYRAFGASEALVVARALRRVTRARKQMLLIGADATLAGRVGADGVHLPESLAHRGLNLRRVHLRWRVTAAAHGPRALRTAQRFGLDAAVVSVVFASRSPSAGRPMGAMRFARLVRGVKIPVIALGGVNAMTAPRLIGTGAAALAAVGGAAGAPPEPRI